MQAWSKVGLIETDRRGRLLPSKTCKLVNVCGTEWLKDIQAGDDAKAATRMCQIMAMLDDMVGDTQEKAAAMGLSEAEDDVYGYEREDSEEDERETVPEAQSPSAEGNATPEGSDEDEDEDEDEEADTLFTIPKDNARMEAMLPELPEFRVCDFISKRSLF